VAAEDQPLAVRQRMRGPKERTRTLQYDPATGQLVIDIQRAITP
jgi:hypothetical protein